MNFESAEPSIRLHHQTLRDDERPDKVNYSVDLKSFYHQLAEDSSSRGFKILEVAGDKIRLRRTSAPEITSKFKVVQVPRGRQSCPPKPQRCFSAELDDDFLLLDTIFDSALENVFDEVEDILSGEGKNNDEKL